jgi:putative ABC transport system permease protein
MPPHIFLLEVAISLLVPVVASLVPVINGVRVTTREALSDYQARVGGPDRLTRFLTRLKGLPRPVLLSLRNTFRNRRRLALTMGTMTLAGVLFITVANTRDALMSETALELEMWRFEVELNLSEPYPVREITSVARRVPGVAWAEGRAYAAAQRVLPDGSREATFFLIGLPPETEQVIPNIIAGRWLRPDDRNAIVLNTEITRVASDLNVGDDIVIEYNGQKYGYNVVGIASMFVDRMAYAPIKYMAPAYGDRGTVTAIDVDTEPRDSATQNRVGRELEKYLKDRGVGVGYWMTNDMIVSSSSGQIDFLVYFLLGMAAMSALIGGLGLSSALGINVMERTREIGVMRSVGATGAVIGFIVIVEGMFIGLVSWLLAIPLSLPTAMAFNTMLGNTIFNRPLSMVFTWTGPLIWLVAVIIISVVASVLPARRASGMSVRETLAYE